MLEPDTRQLLLASLEPPAGFALDRAVGTTFSLDLDALLIAPLAFALLDAEGDDGRPDPIALLEAVRRSAARTDIFCQAGQIAVPATFERVLAFLEDSVHPVVPDARNRVFHPKVWVLRFVDRASTMRYRMLCLSRNLTFDRSWDTVVLLEGEPTTTAAGNGAALADFVRALPDLKPRGVTRARRTAILELAAQLPAVSFSAPLPFDDVAFVPLGVRRHRRTALPLEGSELRLIVSPFLGAGLARDFSSSSPIKLVSRAESFDALPRTTLEGFETLVINDDALGTDDDDSERAEATSESAGERAGSTLRGLHAKLYLAERGPTARIWTGSANATAAAFGGNVEFLVELRGHRSRCGVEALLGGEGVTFGTILDQYSGATEVGTPKSEQELLEEQLDTLRHEVAVAQFTATVEAQPDGEVFRLTLAWPPLERVRLDGRGRVWPISLTNAHARPFEGTSGGAADFGAVPFDRLTSFFAIELTLRSGSAVAKTTFVVNAALVGAPENRGDRMVGRLLESRENVLRYLLLLLADDGFAADGSGPVGRLAEALHRSDDWGNAAPIPLLESLVKTLARDPDRLDQVARVIDSLRATAEGASLLPEGFDEVWAAVWDAKVAAR